MGWLAEMLIGLFETAGDRVVAAALWLFGYNEDWESTRPGVKRRPILDAFVCLTIAVLVLVGFVVLAWVLTRN